jgi:hypothetical protein
VISNACSAFKETQRRGAGTVHVKWDHYVAVLASTWIQRRVLHPVVLSIAGLTLAAQAIV